MSDERGTRVAHQVLRAFVISAKTAIACAEAQQREAAGGAPGVGTAFAQGAPDPDDALRVYYREPGGGLGRRTVGKK